MQAGAHTDTVISRTKWGEYGRPCGRERAYLSFLGRNSVDSIRFFEQCGVTLCLHKQDETSFFSSMQPARTGEYGAYNGSEQSLGSVARFCNVNRSLSGQWPTLVPNPPRLAVKIIVPQASQCSPGCEREARRQRTAETAHTPVTRRIWRHGGRFDPTGDTSTR